MGERTLLTLTDGKDKIRLYLHWYNIADCEKAVKETMNKTRNNIEELAKFVTYFILDHEEKASIYVVPSGIDSYGEDQEVEIDISELRG